MKIPDYYKTPLRSRDAIVDYLLRLCPARRGGSDYRYYENLGTNAWTQLGSGPWLFCWNVKARKVDFSFNNLLKRYQETQGELPGESAWVEKARHVYAGINQDNFWEWGVEGARRPFVDDERSAQGRPGDDGYNMLWDGTPVDARFMFAGRSGGWLVLTRFNRQTLSKSDLVTYVIGDEARTIKGLHEDTAYYFNDWSYKDLRKLYKYVVMLDADLQRDTPEDRIEECAAFDFVANLCGHIDQEILTEQQLQVAQNWP